MISNCDQSWAGNIYPQLTVKIFGVPEVKSKTTLTFPFFNCSRTCSTLSSRRYLESPKIILSLQILRLSFATFLDLFDHTGYLFLFHECRFDFLNHCLPEKSFIRGRSRDKYPFRLLVIDHSLWGVSSSVSDESWLY